MQRTVPSATSEEIRLYRSTIYSLLRSSTEVQIRTLEEIHAGMNSLLHPNARQSEPDISAFIYSLLRLPDCMPQVRSVVLGQSDEVFVHHGYAQVESWQPAPARARRRRCFFDGQTILACYIASRSDIEDIIPTLTAYQMEWNKMHYLLHASWPAEIPLASATADPQAFASLAATLQLPIEDLERLHTVWGDAFAANLELIRSRRFSLGVRLLAGSLSSYQRATHAWWEPVAGQAPALRSRPVYFVSSNTHVLPNLLTGFALRHADEIIDYVQREGGSELQTEWAHIQSGQVPSSKENFLYYVLKKYQQTPAGHALIQAQRIAEEEAGIVRVPSEHAFDVEAQVIDLERLNSQRLDPRLLDGGFDFLKKTDALILNIDYPLGLAAYNILSKVAEQVFNVLGVYVMGKAATLNAIRGDVMIPTVVQDEHSHNTYLFDNCFSANDVTPYLTYGTVLDNQKALSVLGTFLQNVHVMDVFYTEGYADIEMEAGPYLSAVFEMSRPKRHPLDEIVHLYHLPFDLGFLHYASDTPLGKGKNLGAGTLSYFGMDSTYATALAILRRIFQKEREYWKG
ncbi:MAG: hypothetical protein JW987_04895 [Anaerolineaceae bacterium]|nr:hypothetical protein [Anaerolineaceae bacterium]